MPFGSGSILTPIDLSRSPEPAIDWAVAIARLLNADLELYFAAPRRTDEPLLREELRALAHYAERQIADRPGLKVSHFYDPSWDPATAILTQARTGQHRLIVQVTRERSALERLLGGSTTDDVIAHAPCPVLAVPDDLPAPTGPVFRRILAATDLAGHEVLQLAAGWSRLARAGLTYLYVVDASHAHLPEVANASDPQRTFDTVVSEARRRLNTLLHEDANLKPSVPYEVEVRVGDSVSEIAQDIQMGGYDLLIAGHRQRGVVARILLGSVAEEVLHRADVPALIVPTARSAGG